VLLPKGKEKCTCLGSLATQGTILFVIVATQEAKVSRATFIVSYAYSDEPLPVQIWLCQCIYIGKVCFKNQGEKHQRQQHATVATVLALATLGDATQIGSFMFVDCSHSMYRQA
jgi:hypothetical protein